MRQEARPQFVLLGNVVEHPTARETRRVLPSISPRAGPAFSAQGGDLGLELA
jgi:hypothetical protein